MNLPRSISAVRSISVVIVIVTLFLPAALMHASETASCTFNTFSAPSGYSLNQVGGVSDDGTVVGQLVDNKTLESVGFMYSASGVFTEYAVPKSASTWIYGRNGSGANAGTYQDTSYPQHMHGFLLQSGQLAAINYPKAPNTWLFDANQIGGVVGSYTVNPSLMKGFMLMNGNYTSLAYPKAQATYAFAVNDNGAIVGSAPIGLVSNGFLWQNGKFTTINYPNSRYGTALQGINNSGVIVGNHLSSDRYFGFVYENGVFKNIVYSGANYTVAGGINNNGLISGQIFYKGGKTLGYTAVCK